MTLSPEMQSGLIEIAVQARGRAYAPYSHYEVGAALLAASGKVYSGVNVENSAYPGEREFEAIAVVTTNGGMPCGSCRQVLAEFGLDIRVIIADTQGNVQHEMPLSDLLPGAFSNRDLM